MMLAALAALVVYHGTVLKVIDGDTLKVHVAGFPAAFDPIDVRVMGVDAPEHVKPPAQAECEVALGLKAQAFARTLAAPGQTVTLAWTPGHNDKYRRLLASVTLPGGRDWAATMIAAGMGRAYGGAAGLHKIAWC